MFSYEQKNSFIYHLPAHKKSLAEIATAWFGFSLSSIVQPKKIKISDKILLSYIRGDLGKRQQNMVEEHLSQDNLLFACWVALEKSGFAHQKTNRKHKKKKSVVTIWFLWFRFCDGCLYGLDIGHFTRIFCIR